jgi:glycosyltransferase involved in cell wall biosynthesis
MTPEPGLVSVVIPTYNRAALVLGAIHSVLSQTYKNIEVIVVDDGSNDDTEARIQSEFGGDARVRYFKKENGGVSSARNFGIRESRGEYIALLDSDDVWLPGKLELQVECLRRIPTAGMVWTEMEAFRSIHEGERIVGEETVYRKYLREMYHTYRFFPRPQDLFAHSIALVAGLSMFSEIGPVYFGDIFSEMVLGNLVHTSTVLLRRTRQKEAGFFDERFRTGEDYKFHLKTCRAGPVAFVDVPTIRYRIGESDALSSPKMLHQIATNYLSTVEETLREDRERIRLPAAILNKSMADAHNWVGTEELEAGSRGKACMHFLKSLRFKPVQVPAYKNLLKAALPDSIIALIRKTRGR